MFEKYFEGCRSDFKYLEEGISEQEADKYYSHWMGKYKNYFKENTKIKTIDMGNRCLRAKREIITSASMFEEAKTAQKCGCISATYFLTYYSLFHAMWAVIFLNCDIDKSVAELTHSKLKKIFSDYYARGHFFNIDMPSFINECCNMREIFSYNVPYNMIDKAVDIDVLEQILLKCFQLAHLHSYMLAKRTTLVTITKDHFSTILETYKLYNARKDTNHIVILDPAEENQLHEIFKYGIRITPFDVELAHDWDEMGYSDSLKDKFDEDLVYNIKSKAISMVYKAITF